MWVAVLALVVASSGTAVAGVSLARNSVATKHLKKDAVISEKVKNGTLRKADFRPGTLLRGPAGPTGPRGLRGYEGKQGVAGPWMVIAPDGTIGHTSGVAATVTHPATGLYCVTGPFIAATGSGRYLLSVINSDGGYEATHVYANSAECGNAVKVNITFDETPIDSAFIIASL